MPISIYISSTYRDLIGYREKVRNTLDTISSFKVIGMENYTAGTLSPLDQCLKDVQECDIYMLILANRYGYVIPEFGKSVTQLEYEEAKKSHKIILAFRCEDGDTRFEKDIDENDITQPSAEEKQAKLNALKAEVRTGRIMHPEGFTSEYHLALQVMESLVKSPLVDFDGVLPEDRKIFCDRTAQVTDFYELIRKKTAFNVFLIQGQRTNLGRSLVERLCRYQLGVQDAVKVSYHEFILDPSLDNFKRRLVNELCYNLLPTDPNPPSDVAGLLSVLKKNGTTTLPLVSLVSNAMQWESGYGFLDSIFKDFDDACKASQGIQVFWFLVIDSPEQLKQAIKSVNVYAAPPLTMLSGMDVENWLGKYIADGDDEIVLSLQELCFPQTLEAVEFNMKQVQEQIREFINRYNVRRKFDDVALRKILP